MKEVGINSPVDLPDPFVITFGATAYGGVNIGMNMAGSVTTYYVDAKVWVESHATCGSVIAPVACVNAGFTCNPSLFVAGEYNSDGTWYVKGDFDFPFAGHLRVGAGVDCDGSCEDESVSIAGVDVPTCITGSIFDSGFDFGFHAKMGSDGSDIEFTGF